jgi:TPR repeat protein
LNLSEYQVKTKVPSAIFRDFVKCVEDKPIQVTEANFIFLRDLSQEFGFHALSADCEAFEALQANTDENSKSSLNSVLVARLCGVEERQLSLERSVSIEMNKIRSLVQRNDFLEREVSRLSMLCKDFDRRLSKQNEVFESEQCYRRGSDYFYGTNGYGEGGEEISRTLGLSLLKSSADAGHSDAQYRYGRCLLLGKSCVRDVVAAVRYLKQSADSHNSYAECQYGECLQTGSGVVEDERRGTEYIKRSADRGNALGQSSFGRCLQRGIGVKKNVVRAVEYYKLSADQGNADAQNSFGVCLQNGSGIEKDLVRGAEYYKLSADQGNAVGQTGYVLFLEHEIGFGTDGWLLQIGA